LNTKLAEVYNNPYLGSFLIICFVVFGAVVAPELPPSLAGLLANPIVKVVFMAMILVMRRYSPVLALLVSIAFVLSVQTLHRYQSFDMLKNWRQTLRKSATSVEQTLAKVDTTGRSTEEKDLLPPTEKMDTQDSGPHGFQGTVVGSPLD
jgi:hypothetical protein